MNEHDPAAAGPGPADDCPACARLRRAGPGDPFWLADLRAGVAVLHKHQRYPGWCTLWLRRHAEHTADLDRATQAALWEDVADLAAAMRAALGPVRINYENLGNVVPHVHWHLIPRRADDPDPRATVWVRPSAETECGCDEALRDDLVARLRARLRG